jgi:enoyl-[acyl-carrier protein] reductase I
MLLKNKVALVTGITNEHSIAYFIAKEYVKNGAEVIITYQSERLKETVEAIGESIGAKLVTNCDAAREVEVKDLFTLIDKKYGGLDILVHCIAYASKNELSDGITNVPVDGYKLSMDISVYTLIGMTKYAEPLMKKRGGGSIITLTYIGAVRVVENYGIMGVAKAALEAVTRYLGLECGTSNIRVNAISPGPMKTVAARSIPGFLHMYNSYIKHSFLKKHVEGDDIAGTAIFLASDLSKMVTGTVIYVDGGFHCSALI